MYKVCFVSVREGAGHRHRSGRIQQYLPLAQRHQLPETVHSENRDRTKALAGQLHQRLKKKKKKIIKRKLLNLKSSRAGKGPVLHHADVCRVSPELVAQTWKSGLVM